MLAEKFGFSIVDGENPSPLNEEELTDPLCCPNCLEGMEILSFIGDPEVVKRILKHLGLWDIKARLTPKAITTPPDFSLDYPELSTGQYVLSINPSSLFLERENKLAHT